MTIGFRVFILALVLALGCVRAEENVAPKAIELFQQGKTDDALKLLTQAIANEPKNASLYKLRSRIYARLNEHGKAAADINQVAELGEPDAFRHVTSRLWNGLRFFQR